MLCRFSKTLRHVKIPDKLPRRSKATVKLATDSELESAKPFSEIPGDLRVPLIGTVWTVFPLIGKYNIEQLDKADFARYKQYGKISRDDIGSFLHFVHLYDVQDIEKVFRSEGRYPVRLPFQTIETYRKKRRHIYPTGGLLVDSGTEWYNLRSKAQKHMLRFSSVHYYLPGMDIVSHEMVHRMDKLIDGNGEIPNFLHELYNWALESISLVALDAHLGCLKTDSKENPEALSMIKAVGDIFGLFPYLEFSSLRLWKYFPTPKAVKLFKAMDIFTSVSQKYIADALERLKSTAIEEREITFLENLLVTEKMDMGSVNTMITDMLLAGIDTTSHTTAFCLYHLAKNPDAQERLYEEIQKLLPDPKMPITSSILNECRYLKSCLKESMRLIPTIPGTTRILSEDIVLSGYRIPAGTTLLIENMTICRLEENFADPLKYKPERWLREDSIEKKLNPFVYLPFGFGPRSCIGRRIAEQEMYTFFIRVFQKFRIEYHYEDINPINKLTNSPDKPLKIKFIHR